MDEATSALDNRAQEIVSSNVANLKITRIVIAHRLSTVAAADRILVVDRGEIVEEGDFETLMRREGAFFELAKLQLLQEIKRET